MTSSKRLGLAAALCLVAAPSLAVLPPQAKLLDSKVSLPCIVARPSWLARGKRGPAVSLTNKCDDSFIVVSVATRTATSPETPAADAKAVLATRQDGVVRYVDVALGESAAVKPLETLIVPVSWGTHYNIAGHMPGTDGMKFSATGWMIDPANPAQAMDIISHETMKPQ